MSDPTTRILAEALAILGAGTMLIALARLRPAGAITRTLRIVMLVILVFAAIQLGYDTGLF